jgi:hypothetical protein
VGSHPCVIELLEEGVVFFCAVGGGEAEGLDAFDEDFGGVGLGFDDLDGFGDVVLERHGARVGSLAGHKFGLDVRRGEFDDFDVSGFELIADGFAPTVNGGLGGAVGGGDGHGDEGETGGDGHDGGMGLLEEVREQRGGEADGAEKIGGDDGLGVGGVRGLEEVFGAHDAGVMDDDVERREVGGELLGEGADAGGVFDVQGGGGHAWVGGYGLVEDLLAATGDDDFVAELVEGLGEAAADAGAAAGDKDGVSGGFHGGFLLR